MPKEILLIEDTNEIRRVIELSLKKEGYQVTSFDRAESVLKFWKNKRSI